MVKGIHLIPVDGLGGVEAAARSYINSDDAGASLRIMYLARGPAHLQQCHDTPGLVISSNFASINNPLAYVWAFFRIVSERPDVLICSLWRTMLIGILYKILFPEKKFVCFLHNTNSMHILDKVLNNLALGFCNAIWSDSDKTLEHRIPERHKSGKVLRSISFVLERYAHPSLPENAPLFVFWGRLHYQKGLDRALHLFAAIVRRYPEARFYIYGPDDGEEARLRALTRRLGLFHQVSFMGITSFEQLKCGPERFSYYLQLSRFEGMAIAVVEAMQLGLLPIVTPVGEIVNYCTSENAIVVENPDDVEGYAEEVCRILRDRERYAELQRRCVDTWMTSPTYSRDIVKALNELLC